MGCHTWFYKKLNPQPSYQEVKEYVLNNVLNPNQWDEVVNNTQPDWMKKLYPEWTIETGKKFKEILERQYRIVSKDLCKHAVCNRYEYDNKLTIYHNNMFYITSDKLPHDLFRLGGYPDDKLMSYDETIQYIENKGDLIHWKIELLKGKLKEFWDNNPDGLIEFG